MILCRLNLQLKKTGLFCVNDLYALQALNATHRKGIKVPEELNIVGFDNINVCTMSYPTLTSVSQPMDKIASESFDLLIKKSNEQKEGNSVVESIVLRPSLAKRDS